MKNDASDYLEVAQAIYVDACAKCIADVSNLRDLMTMRSRTENEGMSFLTLTLPKFCRDFERSLTQGFVDSTLFREFAKRGSIPAFLSGMTSRIFSMETGRLFDVNEDNDLRAASDVPTIIGGIRQLCLAFKKLELPCTRQRVQASLASFTEVELSLSTFSAPQESYSSFCAVSFMLWSRMVRTLCVDQSDPKHGPGATAEGISGNRKYTWLQWYDRLNPYFPVLESTYGVSAFESPEFGLVSIIPREGELPVKVTLVPKTLKSPRIIAIEPCCMQYAQQALRRTLCGAIEEFELTAGHINFRDQSVNQRLAISSSITGQLATIDLSDASDRVPWSLVKELFRWNPDFLDSVDSCRSTHAKLPDGTVIGPLGKFASMGSALCFPVESMYFYTLCVAALLEANNLPISYANCFVVSRQIYVYGDDILVPATNANAVLDYLQKYNCKVNAAKTFTEGNFRESCGADAFNGVLVTPVYLRKPQPKDRRQASSLISWVATANQFFEKGYWKTAQLMFRKCERYLGKLPLLPKDHPGLGRNCKGIYTIERWSKKYHRFEVKAWLPQPVFRTGELGGYAALRKSLEKLEDLTDLWEVRDKLHLKRYAQHNAVTLKRCWVSAT